MYLLMTLFNQPNYNFKTQKMTPWNSPKKTKKKHRTQQKVQPLSNWVAGPFTFGSTTEVPNMQEPQLRYRAMRCEKTEHEPPNLGLKIMFLLLKKLSFQKPTMSSMFSFGGVVLGGLLILTVSGDRGLYHPCIL